MLKHDFGALFGAFRGVASLLVKYVIFWSMFNSAWNASVQAYLDSGARATELTDWWEGR